MFLDPELQTGKITIEEACRVRSTIAARRSFARSAPEPCETRTHLVPDRLADHPEEAIQPMLGLGIAGAGESYRGSA